MKNSSRPGAKANCSRRTQTDQPRGTTPDTTLSPDAVRAIKSTPIAVKVSGSRTYVDTLFLSKENRVQLREELNGYFLGPMPVQSFLNKFAPKKSKGRSKNEFEGIKYPSDVKRESVMYKPLIDAARKLMPSLTVEDVSSVRNHTVEKTSASKAKSKLKAPGRKSKANAIAPDIGVYSSPRDAAFGADFPAMRLFFEVKRFSRMDPFQDPTGDPTDPSTPFEKLDDDNETRGQIASYILAMTGSQYRLFGFAVGIFGEAARLFRWDASGIVVTTTFNYIETRYLAEFLARFNKLSEAAQGSDPSVMIVNDEWPVHLAPKDILEELAYDRQAEEGGKSWQNDDNSDSDDGEGDCDDSPEEDVCDREDIKPGGELGDNKEGKPSEARTIFIDDNVKFPARIHRHFCLMKIPSRDNAQEERDVVISFPPKLLPRSLVGRSTRPLYGYDIREERLVFIKQYWRACSPNAEVEKEGDIYKSLHAAGVCHLATFGDGNDVRDYQTVTQGIRNAKPRWASDTKEMVPYHLYRMCLETLGRPLLECTSIFELFTVIRDAMACHDAAFFKARVLHRDISPGNIMIDAQGRGFLIDWDLCVRVGTSASGQVVPRRPERTATSQFLSARLLRHPEQQQTIVDDREAALWVLLWTLVRFFPHNQQNQMANWTQMFAPSLSGANSKEAYLNSVSFNTLRFPDHRNLHKFLKEIRSHFNQRYVNIPEESDSDGGPDEDGDEDDDGGKKSEESPETRKWAWSDPDAARLNQIRKQMALDKIESEGYMVKFLDKVLSAIPKPPKSMPPEYHLTLQQEVINPMKRKAYNAQVYRTLYPFRSTKSFRGSTPRASGNYEELFLEGTKVMAGSGQENVAPGGNHGLQKNRSFGAPKGRQSARLMSRRARD